jgi:hypothetical protein
MTFQEILDAAYDDQGYQSFRSPQTPGNVPAEDVVTRFKRWANEGVRDLLGRPRLYPLRHGTHTFTSVPGEPIYGVGESFDVIDTIVQQTNDLRLRAMTRDWYRSIDPGERSQGTAYAWIEVGYAPVHHHPLGNPVYAWSSSAADTTQTVYMRANTTDGTEHPEVTGTLNGNTLVKIGPYDIYNVIRTLSISAPAQGLVVLFDRLNPTPTNLVGALGGILAGTTGTQYHQIRLWPTPSAAEPYLVDGQLKVLRLVNPTDVPVLIPALYHSAIVDYINTQAYAKNGDFDRAAAARSNYERRISELCNKVEYSADYRPIKGALGPDALRWNNLGPWFPADGWGR